MATERRDTTHRLVFWGGLVLSLFSFVTFAMNSTAMPVVLDVPLIALGFGGAAVVLLAIHLVRSRAGFSGASFRAAIAVVALCAALVVVALSAQSRFFSYAHEEIRATQGTVTLAGTLYLPRSEGPHAAAVFVHGSGPESRADYAYYAKRFAQAGIAGLVYDKRGVGESTGKLYGTDYEGYAADAAAMFRALRSRDDIGGDAIGFVGFSEGEWTAPLAADMVGKIAFLAVVGPSGVSPAEQVNAEIALRMRSRGTSQALIDKALELNDRVFEYQRTGHDAQQLQTDLDAASSEPWFRDAKDIPSQLYSPEDYAWWRSVMDFDARPVWKRISAPVLLIKGGRDALSPVEPARREITDALAAGGNAEVEFVLIPNGGHMLLEWPLGEGVPPPLLAERWVERLIDWVVGVTGESAQ